MVNGNFSRIVFKQKHRSSVLAGEQNGIWKNVRLNMAFFCMQIFYAWSLKTSGKFLNSLKKIMKIPWKKYHDNEQILKRL